jgi:hypothetical protein
MTGSPFVRLPSPGTSSGCDSVKIIKTTNIPTQKNALADPGTDFQ